MRYHKFLDSRLYLRVSQLVGPSQENQLRGEIDSHSLLVFLSHSPQRLDLSYKGVRRGLRKCRKMDDARSHENPTKDDSTKHATISLYSLSNRRRARSSRVSRVVDGKRPPCFCFRASGSHGIIRRARSELIGREPRLPLRWPPPTTTTSRAWSPSETRSRVTCLSTQDRPERSRSSSGEKGDDRETTNRSLGRQGAG